MKLICEGLDLSDAVLKVLRATAVRTKNIAEARQIAMYRVTEYLNIPLEAVGDIFGKNHATVIYAKNKVAEDIKQFKKLEIQINDIKQMIEGK